MKILNKYLFFYGGIFSNFYPCIINIKSKSFTSSEQYFMYLKAIHFKDLITASKILLCKTPLEAKQLGRKVINFNSESWDKVKINYMEEALISKFSQNKDLKKELLSKKDFIFVESSPYDKIWGIGLSENEKDIENPKKWKGENLLGKCLNNIILCLSTQ